MAPLRRKPCGNQYPKRYPHADPPNDRLTFKASLSLNRFFSFFFFGCGLFYCFPCELKAAANVDTAPPKIRHILIDRTNVFGPSTPRHDQFPFSTLNILHIITKENFIRSEIIFIEGDGFNQE